MINKGDGNMTVIDMAISIAEFLVNLITSLLSGDFSALSNIFGGLTEKKDLW